MVMYFSIVFWHLYQTHTYSNNPNDGEMITSHLMFEQQYKTTFLWYIFNVPQENTLSMLSRSYIKRFVWYNLYGSQLAFKF